MMSMTGYTTIVLYSLRLAVVNFIAGQSCKMEDTLDQCSS